MVRVRAGSTRPWSLATSGAGPSSPRASPGSTVSRSPVAAPPASPHWQPRVTRPTVPGRARATWLVSRVCSWRAHSTPASSLGPFRFVGSDTTAPHPRHILFSPPHLEQLRSRARGQRTVSDCQRPQGNTGTQAHSPRAPHNWESGQSWSLWSVTQVCPRVAGPRDPPRALIGLGW